LRLLTLHCLGLFLEVAQRDLLQLTLLGLCLPLGQLERGCLVPAGFGWSLSKLLFLFGGGVADETAMDE
jgi:hypothetical protein